MSDNTQNTVVKSELFGRVKWFHRKLGYGFITTIFPTTETETKSQDIFVHHNVIKSEEESYRYLVPGEYVQFNLVATVNSTYQYQADEVRGIYSGKLMCDAHNEQKKHTSTVRSPPFKRENKEPYERSHRYRDRDRDYDSDHERDRDPDTYSRSRYTYTTPRSQFSVSQKSRIYPEYKYDERRIPATVNVDTGLELPKSSIPYPKNHYR